MPVMGNWHIYIANMVNSDQTVDPGDTVSGVTFAVSPRHFCSLVYGSSVTIPNLHIVG